MNGNLREISLSWNCLRPSLFDQIPSKTRITQTFTQKILINENNFSKSHEIITKIIYDTYQKQSSYKIFNCLSWEKLKAKYPLMNSWT